MSNRKPRCSALDMDGRQCPTRTGLIAQHYHGNGELYSYGRDEPKWVVVYLCPKHRESDTTTVVRGRVR